MKLNVLEMDVKYNLEEFIELLPETPVSGCTLK